MRRIFPVLRGKSCKWPLEGDKRFPTSDGTEPNHVASELAQQAPVPAGLECLKLVKCPYSYLLHRCINTNCSTATKIQIRQLGISWIYPVSWRCCRYPHDMLYYLFLSWFHTQTFPLKLGKHWLRTSFREDVS